MILNNGTTDIILPDALRWTDEHTWTPVAARDGRGITGAMLRQTSLKIAGRPLTLEPPQPDMAFVLYPVVKTLQAWASDPDTAMTLTFANDDEYAVVFRYDTPPIKAEPVFGFSNRLDTEYWRVSLYLITTA